jgi:hypothetical protein
MSRRAAMGNEGARPGPWANTGGRSPKVPQ